MSLIRGQKIALFVGSGDLINNKFDERRLLTEIPKANIVRNELYELGYTSFMVGDNMNYMNEVVFLLKNYHPLDIGVLETLD